MHHHTSFYQLPPLRQSLSNSSLHSSTHNGPDVTLSLSSADHTSATRTNTDIQTASLSSCSSQYAGQIGDRILLPLQQQHGLPASPTPTRGRADSDQRIDSMYPTGGYVPQYNSHQLAQPGYGSIPQQTQQGRMMPAASQGLLPPVYPQSAYGAQSLPGPLPYENLQQQARAPAGVQHTLGSSLGDNSLTQFIGTRANYRYELRVEQQPQRARMCGFGDKDRRPITPPPCVRLIVRTIDTDEEIDVDKIDGAFFVLQVDLWNDSATSEVNVIRASSSAPTQSISTAVPMSYPPPAMAQQYMDLGYGMGNTGFGMQPGYGYPQYVPQSSSHVMYTRNLIGSLTVNASLLKDLDGNLGYWFVLSDLSVRTEGWFRLRMTFIDVGIPQGGGETGLNRSKCPILATIFSDKFQVYSAKKFPGVIESTPLSKCFASQGIKIPIRKDGKGDKNDDDD